VRQVQEISGWKKVRMGVRILLKKEKKEKEIHTLFRTAQQMWNEKLKGKQKNIFHHPHKHKEEKKE
jgi:hypothetical protein